MKTLPLSKIPFDMLRDLYLSEQMPAKEYLDEIERRGRPQKLKLTVIKGGKHD